MKPTSMPSSSSSSASSSSSSSSVLFVVLSLLITNVFIPFTVTSTADAFVVPNQPTTTSSSKLTVTKTTTRKTTAGTSTASHLYLAGNNNNNDVDDDDGAKHNDNDAFQIMRKAGLSLIAATTIFGTGVIGSDNTAAAAAVSSSSSPSSDDDVVTISRGAFVIQTSTGTNNPKMQIDSSSLVKTLFANRKELLSSVGRIESTIQNELQNERVWAELQGEIMSIEDDVVPSIRFASPKDWRVAVRDLSEGKLNFLINGEIVNVSIEPSFSEEEDDLIIKVKGFKGEKLPSMMNDRNNNGPQYGPIRSKLAEFEEFWTFWNEPFKYSPIGTIEFTNGGIILTGTASTIAGAYIGAYAYYLSELEKENLAASAKQEATEAKKREAMEKKKQLAAAAGATKEGTAAVANAKEEKEEEEETTTTTTKEEEEEEETGGRKRRRFRFWKK